jgi:energy-coupling factor transport system permease protein
MGLVRFQTVRRSSIFTRLDFRVKLVMMIALTVIAFVWESPLLQIGLCAAVVLATLLAGVRLSYLRTVLLVMLPFYLFLLVTMGLFNVAQVRSLLGREELTYLYRLPAGWWLVGGVGFTLEGLLYGVNIVFKTLTMALVIPLVIFTTDVDHIVTSLVRAHVPYSVAFVFSATLRFFPVLLIEAQSIIEAQRLRGLAVESMGLLRRARVYARIAVPLILSSLVKSQQLEIVLQSKAFSTNPDRTYLHESTLHTADYLAMAFFVLLVVVAAAAYFGLGVGRFGGPLDFIHR